MNLNLDGLRPGMGALVTGVSCDEALRKRLEDFGLTEGTEVSCRYRSPHEDVTALELRGTVLAIRRRDLRLISGRTL